MIDAILIIVVSVVIGVKLLTIVSTRFRRWLYKDNV
jgi:hypothetical protein